MNNPNFFAKDNIWSILFDEVFHWYSSFREKWTTNAPSLDQKKKNKKTKEKKRKKSPIEICKRAHVLLNSPRRAILRLEGEGEVRAEEFLAVEQGGKCARWQSMRGR